MADTPTFQSNPYGSFDPTQWTNPYSNFYGKALPWPSSYAGTPTNAQGQPIQPPPGMTLNQTPGQPQAPAAQPGAAGLQPVNTPQGLSQPPPGAGSVQGGLQAWGAATPAQRVAAMPASVYGNTGGNADKGSFGGLGPIGYVQQQPQAQQQAAPQAAASAAPNNWQQTLSMLANPGHVTTPGATVPQAAPGGGQPTPGVLQNFLANWQPAQSGPGAGFTQNFNTILRGLQAKGS
jgi:hypothetical protein